VLGITRTVFRQVVDVPIKSSNIKFVLNNWNWKQYGNYVLIQKSSNLVNIFSSHIIFGLSLTNQLGNNESWKNNGANHFTTNDVTFFRGACNIMDANTDGTANKISVYKTDKVSKLFIYEIF
jgi:hypothetical protein